MFQMQSASDCQVIDIHSTGKPGQQLVLAGSNWSNGKCFRSVLVDGEKTVSPSTHFVGNKQIIRSSVFNANVTFYHNTIKYTFNCHSMCLDATFGHRRPKWITFVVGVWFVWCGSNRQVGAEGEVEEQESQTHSQALLESTQ